MNCGLSQTIMIVAVTAHAVLGGPNRSFTPAKRHSASQKIRMFCILICYKNYPGLVNRSIFYPYSSVGVTPTHYTFDVIGDTGSNLTTSNVFLSEKRLRVPPLKAHISGSPGDETERVGQRTAAYGSDAPTTPSFRGGVTDRYFTPIAQ